MNTLVTYGFISFLQIIIHNSYIVIIFAAFMHNFMNMVTMGRYLKKPPPLAILKGKSVFLVIFIAFVFSI